MNEWKRTAPALLVLAGFMFAAYPITRPWEDETTAAGLVAATGSAWWIASHTFAMIGFVAIAFAFSYLRHRGPAVSAWLAVALLLPYYGAETFGLYAAAHAEVADPVALADSLRYQPVAVTTFAAGWVALGIAGVLAARAVSRCIGSRAGSVLAVGLALYLPQFFTVPEIRIAHGVLVAVGCWLLAYALRRSDDHTRS